MPELLKFLGNNIQLIGWPALLAIAWKTSQFTSVAHNRIVAAETTLFSLATNHLPHIEAAMAKNTIEIERGFARLEAAIANLSVQILLLANKPVVPIVLNTEKD